jgi:uncharacterized membrane protein YebE (DUF533 family)
MDYEEFAAGLDEFREAVQAMVAAFQADGFTEEQARRLIVSAFEMQEGRDG